MTHKDSPDELNALLARRAEKKASKAERKAWNEAARFAAERGM
jgi:hypothetical protein